AGLQEVICKYRIEILKVIFMNFTDKGYHLFICLSLNSGCHRIELLQYLFITKRLITAFIQQRSRERGQTFFACRIKCRARPNHNTESDERRLAWKSKYCHFFSRSLRASIISLCKHISITIKESK